MEIALVWKQFFSEWPEEMPRRGVLVSTQDEQVPFCDFFVSDSMVLLERTTPDTVGARKVLLPLQYIAMVKLTEVVKAKPFEKLGFKLPDKPSR